MLDSANLLRKPFGLRETKATVHVVDRHFVAERQHTMQIILEIPESIARHISNLLAVETIRLMELSATLTHPAGQIRVAEKASSISIVRDVFDEALHNLPCDDCGHNTCICW